MGLFSPYSSYLTLAQPTRYQTPGFNPNAPVCQPPIVAGFPNGDPSLPYFKCHSGDLYFEFGTLGQFELPFRDSADLYFMQLVVDYWTSFVRTFDPNPERAFLQARGYSRSLTEVKRSGLWGKVTKTENTLRRLDFPSKKDDFQEIEQCEILELPLTFYEKSNA